LSFRGADPIDGLRREVAEHCRLAAVRDRGFFTLTVPTGGAVPAQLDDRQRFRGRDRVRASSRTR
jgi:hypothetical protein